MQISKILVRGPNWVGDSVLAIPAMKALRERFSAAEITLLVRPWVAGVFTSAPFIDKVWSEDRPSKMSDWSRITRRIRDGQFSMAVLFPNSFESALMTFLGRVPIRLGYATDGRRLLLTNPIMPADDHRHQSEYYLNLIHELSAAPHPSVEIHATAQEKRDARALLSTEGISESEAFLVLNPGAAYGSAKRWGEERFAETADRLCRALNLRVVIIGSAGESTTAERIRSNMQTRATVLSGKTTLETLVGVLSEAALMITNDSGPMHLAAALGVPTIAVFGSTDEVVTGPIGPRTRIVKHPVACSPCLLRQCPLDHRCMTRITVADVCNAAQELLVHA